MLQVDGWGGKQWGARGLTGAEAVVGGIGALALLTWLLIRKGSREAVAGDQASVLEL